jgi:competence protein ComEA
MWKRVIAIAHRFGFTQNEAAVIVFLSVVVVAGSVLSELRSTGATPRQDVRAAYTDADSIFAQRANRDVLRQSPQRESVESRSAGQAESAEAATAGHMPRIALNLATAQQLTALPGIGPATAEKIVTYRREHGPFRAPEDIMKVNGIGQKKYERIRQFITVE